MRPLESYRAGLFDKDGTIQDKNGIPPEVIAGFAAMRAGGALTTVLTGRGRVRLLTTLKIANYRQIITPRTPIGLENGGRFATATGRNNLKYYPLSKEELTFTLGLMERGAARFIAYFPEEIGARCRVWVQNPDEVTTYGTQLSSFAEVFHSPTAELLKMMAAERPCMLAIKPEHEQVKNLFPRDVNAVYNEGFINVNAQGVHKGSGVIDFSDLTGIPLKDMFFAGNDDNDRYAYTVSGIGTIFVGDPMAATFTVPEGTHVVATPTDLGTYLQTARPARP